MRTCKRLLTTGALACVICLGQATTDPNAKSANQYSGAKGSATAAEQQQGTGNQVGNPAAMSRADAAAAAAKSGQPVTNPGFGNQVPNEAVQSGGTPQSNSTYQKDRNGNAGFDLGWMGLLGLVGLFGLARRPGKLEQAEGNPTVRDMRPAGSRS